MDIQKIIQKKNIDNKEISYLIKKYESNNIKFRNSIAKKYSKLKKSSYV